MQIENPSQTLSHNFFLFVNTGSGANVGTTLLQQEVQRIQFVLASETEQDAFTRCNVFIYNMRVNREMGFRRLKKEIETVGNKCYAIVCGGDGTVMWVVTELVKYEIKIAAVPIGVIPLGTGNDFSRELGWGYERSQLLQNQFKNLKKQIRKWLKAKQQYFDIWDIEAQCYSTGKFQKVNNSNNEVIPGNSYKRTFCNYFSFGIDGKIGYSFDMHRQKSRLGNLAMYACMGIIKTMTKTKNLDQLLDTIQISSSKKLETKASMMSTSGANSKIQLNKNSFLARCESSIRSNSLSLQQKPIVFERDYYNILALNINSYTGGVKDIWQSAKTGFIKNTSIEMQYDDVSTSDGKIQIVSFGSSFGIAMERAFGGFSKKVAQGEGPFTFYFREYQNRPKHRTYLQIDGEFIRFTNPKRVTISQSQLVPKGKIKVLRCMEQNN